MKRITSLLFCLVSSGILLAQNYAPFKGDVSKRFFDVEDVSSADYFFYADTVYSIGNETVFQQYYTLKPSNNFNVGDCPFWGGGGHLSLDTTWLGNKIWYNDLSQKLQLLNKSTDTISFNFALGLNDSALVYEDASNKYFIKHTNAQPLTIFSIQDTVKTFRVLHYDVSGNIINSTLHGFDIKLGKNLGLISFFDTYNFPQIETKLELKGQLNPLIGSYQMTYEQMYDWHVGDMLQFKGVFSAGGQPYSSQHYKMMTITDRTETPTTVSISFNESEFMTHNFPNQGSVMTYNIHYQNPISFDKNTEVFPFPYNRADRNESIRLTTYEEDSTSFCGSKAYSILKSGSFSAYCDSCKCVGQIDGHGSSYDVIEFTKGLGRTKSRIVNYGLFNEIDYSAAEIIYHNVNGIACGDRAYMGMTENSANLLTVSPNPAMDYIQTNIPFDNAVVYDMNGKKILTTNQSGSMLNISELSQGVYTIEFSIDRELIRKKLIKN